MMADVVGVLLGEDSAMYKHIIVPIDLTDPDGLGGFLADTGAISALQNLPSPPFKPR